MKVSSDIIRLGNVLYDGFEFFQVTDLSGILCLIYQFNTCCKFWYREQDLLQHMVVVD